MPQEKIREKRQTLFNTILGGCLRTVFALIVALLLSITIEIIGMHTWWEEEGVLHSQRMYEYELEQLTGSNSGIEMIPIQKKIVHAIYQAQKRIFRSAGSTSIYNSISPRNRKYGGEIYDYFAKRYRTVEKYFTASLNIVKVFFLRLSILILSLPLFGVALIVGVTDGLAERDLRRWEPVGKVVICTTSDAQPLARWHSEPG